MQATYTTEANREARTRCTVYARRAMNAIDALLGGDMDLYRSLENGYLATLAAYADGKASDVDLWRVAHPAIESLQLRAWTDESIPDKRTDAISEMLTILRFCAFVGHLDEASTPQLIDFEVQLAERFDHAPTSISQEADTADRISYAQDLALQALRWAQP